MIIVAGGSGTRMKSDVPKQFMELEGKPLLMHTITRFVEAIPDIYIIVVIPSIHQNRWRNLCDDHNFRILHQITLGGETRYHSVKNGLALVPDDVVVGIHDAARPLVNTSTIINTYATARLKGNASPVMPLSESIREVNANENRAVPRENYRIVQTPQCFHSIRIKNAFMQEYKTAFTDDASVLEAYGEHIYLTDGNKENIKITTPEDLMMAAYLLKKIKQ